MNKIMQTNTYPDMISYRAACDCGQPEHDIELVLSVDTVDLDDLVNPRSYELAFYTKTSVDIYYARYPWYTRWCKRIALAARLLFTGRVELNSSFIFNEEQHIADFIKALQEGLNTLHASQAIPSKENSA